MIKTTLNFVSYMEYSADPESKFRYCRVDAELDSLTSTEDAPTLDSEKLKEAIAETGYKVLDVKSESHEEKGGLFGIFKK